MNADSNMPQAIPPALLERIAQAAEKNGITLAQLLEDWLEREEQERRWRAFVQRGHQRGAAFLPAGSDEEAMNDLVNAKIEESRRERAG